MRKVLLTILAVILIMPTLACESGGDGSGGTVDTGSGSSGLTIKRTSVAYYKWVNANGSSVPYSSFGISNVSAGLGRALPVGARIIVVIQPAHGALSRSNTYYTPTADYVGEDSFTFKVADSTGKVYPEVCKLTFKKVDAEPPTYLGAMLLAVDPDNNKVFCQFSFESPGGIKSVKINSQSLSATVSGTPAPYDPTVQSAGGGVYEVLFTGNFTGCTGSWLYDVNATITDQAGNTYIFVGTGLTNSIL